MTDQQQMAESLDTILEATLANSSINSPQDALIATVHSTLLSSGYSLAAIGDGDFGADSSVSTSSLSSCSNPVLPEGWNSSQDVYALQYIQEATKQQCLIKAILMEGQLLVNAMVGSNTAEVFTVSLEISKYIRDGSDVTYTTTSVFKNLLQLMSILSKELEAKLSQACFRSLAAAAPTTSTSSTIPDVARVTRPRVEEGLGDDPLRIGPPRRPDRDDPLRIGPPRRPDRTAPDRDLDPLGVGPFGYGDTDRFPFIGGDPRGGGMVFDPMRQRGGMRGGFGPQGPFPPSHPQGARYDPVHPFGPGPRPRPPGRSPGRGFGEPDPDHLPPPGYDDMFS